MGQTLSGELMRVKNPSSERVVFESLAPDVQKPVRSTELSAGYDVRAHLTRGRIKIHRSAIEAVSEEAPVSDALRIGGVESDVRECARRGQSWAIRGV